MSKKATNKEVINGIRQEMTLESQSRIPVATAQNETGGYYADLFASYPTAKNEFITVLTNKVSKTIIYTKVFKNPLKKLHKGLLPYGSTIEQMFMNMAIKKGWAEHFDAQGSPESDLIRIQNPTAEVDYISINYKYKYKTSISDQQLKEAFTSREGLSNLISYIVASISNSVEYDEYKDMMKILTNATKETAGSSTIDTGIVQRAFAGTNKASMFIPVGAKLDAKALTKKIKGTVGRWKFPSTKYNIAGVNTWATPQECVIFIDPDTLAELDVELLAQAFHTSYAELPARIIEVEGLGETKATGGNKIVCIIADADAIQPWDTLYENNSFYNPERLTTNLFAHKWGLMCACDYANVVCFCEGDAIL